MGREIGWPTPILAVDMTRDRAAAGTCCRGIKGTGVDGIGGQPAVGVFNDRDQFRRIGCALRHDRMRRSRPIGISLAGEICGAIG